MRPPLNYFPGFSPCEGRPPPVPPPVVRAPRRPPRTVSCALRPLPPAPGPRRMSVPGCHNGAGLVRGGVLIPGEEGRGMSPPGCLSCWKEGRGWRGSPSLPISEWVARLRRGQGPRRGGGGALAANVTKDTGWGRHSHTGTARWPSGGPRDARTPPRGYRGPAGDIGWWMNHIPFSTHLDGGAGRGGGLTPPLPSTIRPSKFPEGGGGGGLGVSRGSASDHRNWETLSDDVGMVWLAAISVHNRYIP